MKKFCYCITIIGSTYSKKKSHTFVRVTHYTHNYARLKNIVLICSKNSTFRLYKIILNVPDVQRAALHFT